MLLERSYEMGGECGLCGREDKWTQGFWWGKFQERNHFEHLGTDGMIILKLI
jgi:hypothetical protein